MMSIGRGLLALLWMSAAVAQTPQTSPVAPVVVSPATPVAATTAPTSQNPSPMVEHTRAHPRLTKVHPDGSRETLSLGTLFVPQRSEHASQVRLLVFFLGGDWIPEVAVAQQKKMAVISIQAGAGSSNYEKLFADPARFPALIDEAESKSGKHFSEVDLGGFSAGCGALRKLLRDPEVYARTTRVLCMDGVHAGYLTGEPGPQESQLDPDNLDIWLKFGRDAIAGKKRFVVTHTEIFPGTYASTTETADYLLRNWELTPHAVVRWGPQRAQMLSSTQRGRLLVVGFAGNSAPDHVDQIHSLPEYLRWLMKH